MGEIAAESLPRRAHFPGRQLVGHERGDALAAALDGGFAPLGGLRVWVRQEIPAI